MEWHENNEEQRKLAFSFLEIYFYPVMNNINEMITKTLPKIGEQKWTPEWIQQHFQKNIGNYVEIMNFKEPVYQKELRVSIEMNI